MKKIKKSLFPMIIVAVVIGSLSLIAFPAFSADDYGLNAAANAAGLSNIAIAKKSVPEIVGQIIGILLSFLGVIFMVLLVYGGFLWMTSYGNKDKVEKAKDLITNAVIGIVVILAAYAISTFIINQLTATASAT